MIDIENIVFTKVKTAVKTAFPTATVDGEANPLPETFPHVTIMETNNYADLGSITTNCLENHAIVDYEIQIFTNDSLRKTTAKKIANVVDEAMTQMRFNRTMKEHVPNADRTISRMVLRYHGVIAKGIDIDGSTIYRVYQR